MVIAEVIDGCNTNTFNSLIFPDKNPVNLDYIRNQLQGFGDSMANVGNGFLQRARSLYENINDAESMRAARAALRYAKGIFREDRIYVPKTITELREAKPIMQHYIMAEPTLRGMYHKQVVDGFSDTYTDLEPDSIGEGHSFYRDVMSGIVVDNEDGGWTATNYFSEELGSGRVLLFEEQMDILSTWDLVRMALGDSLDPTDIFNN